ncbi:hypothetical protein Nepgr_005495 [Nepenthes gracilis]|uniref:Auxin-responsive protein n=1 Tax=Nepenthes gracilis TaxID=150966 RepID=A0AAD3S3E8_NEPGR|nr:hypothetical protein Nepgr_005495 [Nepenthes gracilis]
MVNHFPGFETFAMDFKETELTLGPPGEFRVSGRKSGKKRGFPEMLDLNLSGPNGRRNDSGAQLEQEASSSPKSPAAKEQLVGWPPLRASRKNAMRSGGSNYVKVAVDGAPYLRKVDLQMYISYEQLLKALEDMFCYFTIRNYFMEPMNGYEYVPTYEDKDGDWMMVGDVPWKIFVESCKRIRLMKGSEAAGLEPRTPPQNAVMEAAEEDSG